MRHWIAAGALGAAASLSAAWTDGLFLDESLPIGLEENLDRSRPVGLGIEHHQLYAWDEPLFINWVTVDLEARGLALTAVKAGERAEGNELLSTMAPACSSGEHRPIAAINADFWGENGRPVGLCVIGGEVLTLGNGRPAIVRTTDGQLQMGRMNFRFEIHAARASAEVDDVNLAAPQAMSGGGGVVLYTAHSLNEDFPPFPPARLASADASAFAAVAIRGVDAVRIHEPMSGWLTEIASREFAEGWPERTLALVGYGDRRAEVEAMGREGPVEIVLECTGFDGPVEWALGGGPILLSSGEVQVSAEGEQGFRPAFITDRHPRSVVGLGPDRRSLILMVVDGRQQDVSRGMDLIECAEWMLAHGAVDAMNFDGGGSSSLWVRGATESSPSDANGERPVTNGLVILSSVRTDAAVHVLGGPEGVLLPEELDGRFPIRSFDEGWNPLPAMAGAPAADTRSERAAIARWTLLPAPLEVAAGERVTLHPRAFASDGRRIAIPRHDVALAASPEDLAAIGRDERDRLTLTGLREGRGLLEILRVGDENLAPLTSFPLVVGHLERRVADGLEARAELPSLELVNFDASRTALSWTDEAFAGERALAIDYAMSPGGTSTAHITLGVPLSSEARRVGLQVRGDGGAAWLRGIVSDRDRELFVVDFTSGTRGIHWSGEWRWVEADLTNLRAHWDNPEARAEAPFTLDRIYLAQSREASKTSGRVLFDDVGFEIMAVAEPRN